MNKTGLVDDLKAIAIKYIKQQIMAQLVKSAPWLFGSAVGWLSNPIIGFILDSLLGFLLDRTILGVSLVWIAIDVQYDVKSAEDATAALKAIFDNPEKYTEEQTKQAEANFDEQAVELIRIGIANL